MGLACTMPSTCCPNVSAAAPNLYAALVADGLFPGGVLGAALVADGLFPGDVLGAGLVADGLFPRGVLGAALVADGLFPGDVLGAAGLAPKEKPLNEDLRGRAGFSFGVKRGRAGSALVGAGIPKENPENFPPGAEFGGRDPGAAPISVFVDAVVVAGAAPNNGPTPLNGVAGPVVVAPKPVTLVVAAGAGADLESAKVFVNAPRAGAAFVPETAGVAPNPVFAGCSAGVAVVASDTENEAPKPPMSNVDLVVVSVPDPVAENKALVAAAVLGLGAGVVPPNLNFGGLFALAFRFFSASFFATSSGDASGLTDAHARQNGSRSGTSCKGTSCRSRCPSEASTSACAYCCQTLAWPGMYWQTCYWQLGVARCSVCFHAKSLSSVKSWLCCQRRRRWPLPQ